MIKEAFRFKMPSRLGILRIRKFKNNNRTDNIDWGLTNKYYGEYNKEHTEKKRIYYANNHSQQYGARWWWEQTEWVKYHSLYRVKATRTN